MKKIILGVISISLFGCSQMTPKRNIASVSDVYPAKITPINVGENTFLANGVLPITKFNSNFYFSLGNSKIIETGLNEIYRIIPYDEDNVLIVGKHRDGRFMSINNVGSVSFYEGTYNKEFAGLESCVYGDKNTGVGIYHLHKKYKKTIIDDENKSFATYLFFSENKHEVLSKDGDNCKELYKSKIVQLDNVNDVFAKVVKYQKFSIPEIKYEKNTKFAGEKNENLVNFSDTQNAADTCLIMKIDDKKAIDDKKWYASDYHFKEFISEKKLHEASNCRNFKWGRFAVADKETGLWGFFDDHGELVIKPEFQKVSDFNFIGNARAKKFDKWGVIDYRGEWLVPPIYPELTIDENLGVVIAKDDNGKFGVLALDGKPSVLANFDYSKAKVISNKFLELCTESKCNLIDSKGKFILSNFQNVEFALPVANDLFVIRQGKNYELVDSQNNEKIDSGFEEYRLIDNLNVLGFKSQDKWYFMNLKSLAKSESFDEISVNGKILIGKTQSGSTVMNSEIQKVVTGSKIEISKNNKYILVDDKKLYFVE